MLVLPPKQYVASFDVNAQMDRLAGSRQSDIAQALNQQAQWAQTRIGSKNSANDPLISGLPKPDEYTYFIWYGVDQNLHAQGACYHDANEKLSTGIIEYLQTLCVQCVLIGGLSLSDVFTTAVQIRKKGFETIINLHACGQYSKEEKNDLIQKCNAWHIRVIHSLDELSNTHNG